MKILSVTKAGRRQNLYGKSSEKEGGKKQIIQIRTRANLGETQ